MSNTPSLLPCPFCGAPAHGYAIAPHSHSPAVLRLVPELPDHPGCYVIEGQCACGSGLIGANESEVTARWNRRTPQQEAQEPTEIPEEIERMAADRYKVVPSHESMFHRWAVVAGTGTQQLYLGREVECQNMARKFAGAFLDGAFVALQQAAPQQEAQEPVATLHCNDIGYVWARATEVGTRMRFEQPINLYTAPQPAPAPLSDDAKDVVRDAAFEAVRKKLCALPRFSFLSDGYGVRRVPDKSGSWIAFDAAHELFDPVAVDAALAAQGGK